MKTVTIKKGDTLTFKALSKDSTEYCWACQKDLALTTITNWYVLKGSMQKFTYHVCFACKESLSV